jgi:histidine ammonia-lyase
MRILLDGDSLTLNEVVAVARQAAEVQLAETGKHRLERSRVVVERYVREGRVIYGLNTGFGKFSDMVIAPDELETLQKNLIYADAVGIGRPFDQEVTRALMLLRANALAKGYSGIKPSTVQTLLDMLNRGVHPVIPEKGSVGSSGDLCPLAHMVLVMLGEGEAEYRGRVLAGARAMAEADIPTVTLQAKEGLALINGTCAMLAVAALAVADAGILLRTADIAAALTMEVLEGITDAFDPRIHQVRPHKGQQESARNLLRLCAGSRLTTRQDQLRVQDAYSLRCVPQIHGGSRLAAEYVQGVIETELNSATDNPLIFPDGDGCVLSGGNFHGQPIAIAMDTLGIALAEVANFSERRIERLLNPALSGLPAFLSPHGGTNCGFMVAQYAAAAVVSENKVLAHPASVDSIPTCANQEDFVSMGTIAARKAREILGHAQHVLGVEFLCAAQAADFRGSDRLGRGSRKTYEVIREGIPFMATDRVLYRDMDLAAGLVASGRLLHEVTHVIGELE